MSNTDPESTLEQRIARLEELALAQTQGMMLSHHLMEMEQHKESLQRQAQQLPDQPLIAADLTELSQKTVSVRGAAQGSWCETERG